MLIWPGESWWPAAVLPVSGGGGETVHVAHHVPGSSQEQAGVSERLPSCLYQENESRLVSTEYWC